MILRNKKNKIATSIFSLFCCAFTLLLTVKTFTIPLSKKPWTFLVFIAGDNDLAPFIYKNITQMSRIGSTQYLNIVVCLIDSYNKQQKYYRIVFVEKNKTSTVFETTDSQLLDSGSPESLIFFCKKAIESFPADNYGLIFWDHGTGPLDFNRSAFVRTKNIFKLQNKDEQTIKTFKNILNVSLKKSSQKGICFDDTTGNSLSEIKIVYALDIITKNFLQGKKFSLIGCDACFMGMIEIASLFKYYADIMVASEQSEPGAGWNYERVLAPFLFNTISKEIFGTHIINSYKKTYSFYDDHTLSCINLSLIFALEDSIKKISILLQKALEQEINQSVLKTLSLSKNKNYCTSFDEPSFIDLYHFYENLLKNLNTLSLNNKKDEQVIKKNLTDALTQALSLIEKSVIASTAGKKYTCAKGLAIYFPEYGVHGPYRNNIFSKATDWSNFLTSYIQRR